MSSIRDDERYVAAGPMRIVLWCVLLLCSACFFLTGSLIPLAHIEFLDFPHNVERVFDNCIILDDGRKVSFGQLKYLPTNVVVSIALSGGVEISKDGNIYGLLRFYYPGRSPYVYVRKRIDVVALAVATDPDCLDLRFAKGDDWNRLRKELVEKPQLKTLNGGRWRVGNEAWVHAVRGYLASGCK